MAQRRPKNRRNRHSRQSGAVKGGVLLFISVVIVVFVGWQVWAQLSGQRTLDASLCPVNGADSYTAVVVDLTDPLTVAQKQDLINQLEALRNDVPKYGRISLFQVAPAGDQLLRPVLDLCNPGDGSELSEANANPAAARERWEEEFSKPLDAAFRSLAEASGAETSPILQSVQSVALTKLQKPAAKGKPRKLVLVSDLLQNAHGVDFYKHVPTWEELKRSEPYQTAKADLTGVDMEIWMLTRPGLSHLQNTKLAQLWAQAFTKQGAKVTRAYNVNG